MENLDICELIVFKRPDSPENCLFLTILKPTPQKNDQEKWEDKPTQLQMRLEDDFAKFGPLYEVNVVDSVNTNSSSDNHWYGFVRFYSKQDAALAKKQLTGRLFINGGLAKIKFSSRSNTEESPPLYLAACYELANHFLGFNGWSVQILCLTNESGGSTAGADETVTYRCVVQLDLVTQGLYTNGAALAQQTYNKEPSLKAVAICKAKKLAYQEAVRNAFQKVVLLRLTDGRLYVEVNTTLEEALHFDEDLDKTKLLKVTDLSEAPLNSSDEETDLDNDNDELNKLILQQLAQDEPF